MSSTSGWSVTQLLAVQVDVAHAEITAGDARGVREADTEGLMVGPEILLPPCPRKAEVLPARPWVAAPVNPRGLCHLHSAELTLSLGFLGCGYPETPIRAPGTALKVQPCPQAAASWAPCRRPQLQPSATCKRRCFTGRLWHRQVSSRRDFLSWKWPCCPIHLTRVKKSLCFHRPV